MKRIAIIAGEPSGDVLASRLIIELKKQKPDLVFEGIAGPEMQAAGCVSLFPMESLSVMGLAEVLKHLPELLSIRKQLFQYWSSNPPDVFIGVDAPDFNLPLAKKLHKKGIPTAHYVSPSIWAWREKRVKKIRGNIDLMLTLFPFEVDFYTRHGIKAQFVGHPLADEIDFDQDMASARRQLDLDANSKVLALLPGSRTGEIKRLASGFLSAAGQLQQHHTGLQVVIPVVSEKLQLLLEQLRGEYAPELEVTYLKGESRTLMQAADYILLASGTAVLEGMLSGRLMVAAYKVSGLTWWLLQTFRLLTVKYVTLPNHLAGEELVPEVLQDELTTDRLVNEMESLFTLPPERREYILNQFRIHHEALRCNASEHAAGAILEHFNNRTGC
uniref:Lipid-A-disaccharide synthase n=1 Tax=uncultured Thiotrichaceae bacterium TaxID=298394 RepID=A0A6S6SLX7_9GAMM|nr:MAG: Lipid-A-disaccharide synthase (EC [uncultured Thiotrichaceae bacterium]